MSNALYNVSATRELPEWNVRDPRAGGGPVDLYRIEPTGVACQVRRVNL